ncbi:MAG: RluA family pseudouridine synthase [Firmicutes bacterium]|nr:RluA family pseudouridine synthase [Bacillota bacterium]
MAARFLYTVEEAGRLGDFLRRLGYPQGLLASLRQGDWVRVDGAPRRMIEPVFPGQQVEVVTADRPCPLTPNGDLPVAVLYEDDWLWLADKSDDMLMHPAAKGFDDSLGNYFAACHPQAAFRPIGRLDRHTTGLCLAAKDRLTAALLTARPPQKVYYALAQGFFAEKQGRIDAPLLRCPGPQITRRVDSRGQASVTRYQVLAQGDSLSLLRLILETGRTHQIRAHMQYAGHPLAGDRLYGGDCRLIGRQALHVGRLSLRHPHTGRGLCFTRALPADMRRAMAADNLFSPEAETDAPEPF